MGKVEGKLPSRLALGICEAPCPEERGRSTELTALSMPNGLPGKVVSFHIVHFDPALKDGACGALAGHLVCMF